MKVLIHKKEGFRICIFERSSKTIKGCFFDEKPETGDVVMSHTARESNYLFMFRIDSIVENRDAKVDCANAVNPSIAYFELSVSNVTDDPVYSEVDNSLNVLR